MTCVDEKDPPVPADVVDAPKRIHPERTAENKEPSDEEALEGEQND